MWGLPGEPPKPILRGHNVAADFDHALRNLDKAVKKKIRYFETYVDTDEIRLFGIVGSTEIDGRRDLQVGYVHKHLGDRGGLVQWVEPNWVEGHGLQVFDTAVGFEWTPDS
mmetsp:Transcript_24439/g.38436  ORF Transcript_24439/g.38436 Transcript_24439/m.38436 type:complete len:111 (-) Transcript_24439:188-520(-)